VGIAIVVVVVELHMEVVVETADFVGLVDFAGSVELIDLIRFAESVASEEQNLPVWLE